MNGSNKKLDLGDQVRKLREEAGLTQAELGEKAMMSKQQISKIESGERILKGEEISRIIDALDISPNKFFGFEGRRSISEILRDGTVSENKLISLIANVIDEEMFHRDGKQ